MQRRDMRCGHVRRLCGYMCVRMSVAT